MENTKDSGVKYAAEKNISSLRPLNEIRDIFSFFHPRSGDAAMISAY